MSSRHALPERAQLSLAGAVVLCVDDDTDACELIKTMLEQEGAKVITAHSVREAIEALSRSKPNVLIADLKMPVEDGYTLIQKIRKLTPEQGGRIPAVALSALVYPQDRDRALTAGYQAHIPKPFDSAELISTIAKLIPKKYELN